MNPAKVLIVGSQGYLGSRLVEFLSEQGYQCTGADVGFFRNGLLYQPRSVAMIAKEARTLDERDIEGFDVLIQLAGISNDPIGELDPDAIYHPTRAYSLRIAKMCKRAGVRFIFPSSCSVYGIADGLLDESGPTNPQTHYSLNKLQVEQDLAEISDSGFSPIALRLATVFGASPRIRFDVVINMLCGMAVARKRIILNSDGQAWRPHVDIEDVCEALRCCIDWNYSRGRLKVLNVGRNDNNARIIDVARLILKQVPGCELEFLSKTTSKEAAELVVDRKVHDGVDRRTYQVGFDLVHRELPGFSAKWNIEDGVSRLVHELQRVRLDDDKFKQREFYRLQQLEHLHKTGQVTSDLFWKAAAA